MFACVLQIKSTSLICEAEACFNKKNGEAIETPEFLTIPPTGDVDQVKVVTPVATAVPRVVACTGGSQACYILWVNQFDHV